MDTAMRDLDLIQERGDEDSPGRKAAMLGMAGLSTVALVFAMGIVLGGSSEPTQTEGDDPLAALAAVMPAESADAESDDAVGAPPSSATAEAAEVESEVQFHGELTDERPEVEAALAAAAAEAQMLDARGANAAGSVPNVPNAAFAATPTEIAHVSASSAPAGDIARVPTAAAIADAHPVAAGREGAYTLQVVSYRTLEEATLFAEALRSRGHAAFTARADLPGRGLYFRVRVGPFDTRAAADRYRATFEREEAMNSYVVDAARVAASLAASTAD